MKKYKVRYWVVPCTGRSFEFLATYQAESATEASIMAQDEIYQLYTFAVECEEVYVEEDQVEGKF